MILFDAAHIKCQNVMKSLHWFCIWTCHREGRVNITFVGINARSLDGFAIVRPSTPNGKLLGRVKVS